MLLLYSYHLPLEYQRQVNSQPSTPTSANFATVVCIRECVLLGNDASTVFSKFRHHSLGMEQSCYQQDWDGCSCSQYKDPPLLNICCSLMNRSRDPLMTPQHQQQRVCYALQVVAQSIEESPQCRSVAPRPETPTPQPGYIERTRTSHWSSNWEARSADLLALPQCKHVQRPRAENIPPHMLTLNSVMVTGFRQVVCKIMYFLLSLLIRLQGLLPYKHQLCIANSTPSRNFWSNNHATTSTILFDWATCMASLSTTSKDWATKLSYYKCHATTTMYHSNAFASCYTACPFRTYPSFAAHSCSNTQCEVTWSATSSSLWMRRKGLCSTGYSTRHANPEVQLPTPPATQAAATGMSCCFLPTL